MWRAVLVAALAALLSVASAQANAGCEAMPDDVEAYLRAQPSWTPARVEDLVEEDQPIWERAHPGLCPGMAVVDLDGRGQKSYALGLLRRTNDRVFEKLVVVTRSSGRLVSRTLAPSTNISYTDVSSVIVVWRIPPGRVVEWTGAYQVTLRHDGIVYETIDASSRVYYLANGKFKSILASD